MSKIIRGHKYQIYPTEDQARQLDTYINLYRYVYNWGLSKEKELYEKYKQGLSEKKFYSYFDLTGIFTIIRNDPEFYWLKNIPYNTAKNALKDVVDSYKKFFNRQNNFPKFKTKKKSKPSFKTKKDSFKINKSFIKIEGVKTHISLGFDSDLCIISKCIGPSISKDNLGNYYVSFSLEEESKSLEIPKSEPIGIDLGVRRTFTLSTGEIYNQPKEKLDRLERRRRRIDRHVTRDINRRQAEARHTKTKYEDIPKSKRAIKRELKRLKIYRKIHNIKDTYYHTITKQIVMRNPEYVCMETFSVNKMNKENKTISKLLHSASFYDITQKIKDKCEKYNIPFIQAPRYYPSTKMCSNCGSIKDMNSKHTYKCPVCGMVEDRDINAAINLMNYGSQFI